MYPPLLDVPWADLFPWPATPAAFFLSLAASFFYGYRNPKGF